MAVIIDRRKNAKARTLKNRQRFIEIHKKQIADSVEEILKDASISSPTDGTKNKIKIRPASEPSFRNDPRAGNRKYVLPGNRKYVVGDKEPKPDEDSGGRGNEGSMDGSGEDDFMFELSEEEFMDFVFENLELPDMVKKQLRDVNTFTPYRAGYRSVGTPSQMDIIKTTKNALGRRIGLGRPSLEKIEALREEIEAEINVIKKKELEAHLEELLKKRAAVPWIDPFDVKYRNYTMQPRPRTKAVMFCVMDVSFSMSDALKKLAKSFFMLLNLFLKRKYDQVDVVFIKHHSWATETDEQDFFYGKESGGTVVSSAFKMANQIIDERYPLADWNVYCAQASDGDNAYDDMDETKVELNKLLVKCQYFAYVETTSPERSHDQFYGYYSPPKLWPHYEELAKTNAKINMKVVSDEKDVWKVFTELFKKGSKNVKTLV